MLAEAIMFVETGFANVNALTVAIENFPSFRAIIFAILTEHATVMLAILAEKFGRNFARAGNAKPICSNIENFKVMGVVLANRNFCVEVGMNPIAITTKATATSNMNIKFVAAIFFSLPQVRNTFKFRKFALN